VCASKDANESPRITSEVETVRITPYFFVIHLNPMGIILVCYTIPYPHWLFFPIPRTGEIAFVIEILVLQAIRLSKLLICGNFLAF
jgi:hypothetical protein